MQPYCSHVVIISICGCVWREKVSAGKKDRIILFIILLGSLYYFIGLYIKIKTKI